MKHSSFKKILEKSRKILALIGVVLLAGLYVCVLLAAIFDNPQTYTFLKLAIAGTFFLPVMLWVFRLFLGLSRPDSEPGLPPDEDLTASAENHGK